ncbi:ABC transporter permease [Alkalicoccobacillus murimartini]|uniref:Osmoprotectant transport system permease protein n=1 Tax=Alkalicoccobacillus murimartini TaxID=171685 RepID=A0ABT9YKY9_9BACI|nr:ABC transporter permease [Alkalicoccobacillus murimartini]MDQ0208534.1 osmoprotectant transport system permease protein [Alkalicoccobacillus murimartini]
MNKNQLINRIVKIVLYALVLLFFVWTAANGYYNKIFTDSETFFVLFGEHLLLVAVSSILAVIVALPLAVFVTRPKYRKFEWITSNIANLAQTVPSLAVLALMIGILGIGFTPAVFALFIYSVLPIFRNAVAGFNSIDTDMKDAGKGMGMTSSQIFWRIEVPNSSYAIIAGLRTAIVLNVGTAALAYYIGGGGLGVWIFTGINLFDNSFLLSGAVPVTLMAIGIDSLLAWLGRAVTPKGSKPPAMQAVD